MMQNIWRIAWKTSLAVVVLFVIYQIWLLCHVLYLVNHNPHSSAFMENRLAILQDKNSKSQLQHHWVPYTQISDHLKRAIIAAEDVKFIEHDGFDWDGLQKAYNKNIKKRRIVAGGSTISQQLSKNLFLSDRRSPWRKAQEALITVMIEQLMSKRRILEIYLNIIEWGNGIFGAEAAAQHYFNISAKNITAYQATQLAAIVPNPIFYDAHRNTRRVAQRIEILSDRMNSAQIP